MKESVVDRRTSTRRAGRAGGRRATDVPAAGTALPDCPKCRRAGIAMLAGEAEGGWWFVCFGCDHLWDQRRRACSSATDATAELLAGVGARDAAGRALWQRLARLATTQSRRAPSVAHLLPLVRAHRNQ